LNVVTKQSLSFVILRMELEDDLPEFEFGTLTTSCKTLVKWRKNKTWNMIWIYPHISPHSSLLK